MPAADRQHAGHRACADVIGGSSSLRRSRTCRSCRTNWHELGIVAATHQHDLGLGAIELRDRFVELLGVCDILIVQRQNDIALTQSCPRGLALDRIDTPYAAILDADDRMKPDKLARAVALLADHPIVSVALDVMDDSYNRLRLVGVGEDRLLTPGTYKFTALSMDSMIVWDRRRTDARYDLNLPNLTDLELLMQLWQKAPTTFHIGTPLHDYVKLTKSLSNGPDVTDRMVSSKKELLSRLEQGRYKLDLRSVEGLAGFLGISLAAETAYPLALKEKPGLLFEDHIEPMLRTYEARIKQG
jgi:hypothetical protein